MTSVVLGVLLLPYVPLMTASLMLLIVTGIYALKSRLRFVYGSYLAALFAVSATLLYLLYWCRPTFFTQLPIAKICLLSLHYIFSICVLIEGLRVTRHLRIMSLFVESQFTTEEDLESQSIEMAPLPASPSPLAPHTIPAPIYIAAPAYYPQYNPEQVGYAYIEPENGQYMPLYVDASGKPLGPIHTE